MPTGSMIEVSVLQFSKVDASILVTADGKVKEVSLLQSLKAEAPKDVMPVGRLIEVSPLQFSKVDASMVVTADGTVKEVN